MSTTNFATLEDLWLSVPYEPIDPDGTLAGFGFKLRAWIRRDDADGKAVVLTYAPDMIGGRGIRGLLLVMKGVGAAARDRLHGMPGAAVGASSLPDDRLVEWGTRQTPGDASRPSAPASAATWTSRDGRICLVDASPGTVDFVVRVAAELANLPGG